MKTIVLGYANEKATGPATVIAGPEVSIADQIKLITGIKRSNEYPKGVVRAEFCELISRNVGIQINRPAAKPVETKSKSKQP